MYRGIFTSSERRRAARAFECRDMKSDLSHPTNAAERQTRRSVDDPQVFGDGRPRILLPVTPKLARRALGAIITACLALTAISVLTRPAPPPTPHYASLLPAQVDTGLPQVDTGLPQGENIVAIQNPGGDEGTIMIHSPTPKPTPTPRPTHSA